MTWILTHSGRVFDYTNPGNFDIDDIAEALSKNCRFNGHTKEFYSVAQHCVLASYLVDLEDALDVLMHDAAEAYITDVPTPLKRLLPDLKKFEKDTEQAIAKEFGLTYPWTIAVHEADAIMLAWEKNWLINDPDNCWPCAETHLGFDKVAWTPSEAKFQFLSRFIELINA